MKKRLLVSLIALVLSFSFALCACTDSGNTETTTSEPEFVSVEDSGYEKSFIFEVIDKDGVKTQTEIDTDKKILGEALQDLGLIKGEEGDFGIYIKEVNGIVADYDIDGTYWAFYINDAMSMKGADQVEIVDGDVYSFRVEKG